jgi:hypothetical protein
LRRRLGIVLIALALLFLSAIPWPGVFYALRVTYLQRGQDLLTLPFLLHHPFDLSFTNSLFMAPVVEKFEARGPAIFLVEIVTNKWGVVEYYDIPGKAQQEREEIRIRDIHFQAPKLSLMIGFIGKQKLIWDRRKYALYELTEPGGILRIEVKNLSPLHYCWQRALYFLKRSPKKGV